MTTRIPPPSSSTLMTHFEIAIPSRTQDVSSSFTFDEILLTADDKDEVWSFTSMNMKELQDDLTSATTSSLITSEWSLFEHDHHHHAPSPLPPPAVIHIPEYVSVQNVQGLLIPVQHRALSRDSCGTPQGDDDDASTLSVDSLVSLGSLDSLESFLLATRP